MAGRRREAEAEPGWLAGLPVAIKDLTDVAGVRTTYGSPIFADHVPTKSHPLVERIERKGGIVIAKSNTPEFGAGGNTFNEVFGRTRNPWNTSLTCGGSTGGGAVAFGGQTPRPGHHLPHAERGVAHAATARRVGEPLHHDFRIVQGANPRAALLGGAHGGRPSADLGVPLQRHPHQALQRCVHLRNDQLGRNQKCCQKREARCAMCDVYSAMYNARCAMCDALRNELGERRTSHLAPRTSYVHHNDFSFFQE
jgi:hypothetical protein